MMWVQSTINFNMFNDVGSITIDNGWNLINPALSGTQIWGLLNDDYKLLHIYVMYIFVSLFMIKWLSVQALLIQGQL